MKKFHCSCGSEVFFENTSCQNCARPLGFDPSDLEIKTLQRDSGENWTDPNTGQTFRFCSNYTDYSVCNWLIPASESHLLCQGCRLNRTIPDLRNSNNLIRWRKIEKAKKRLLYTLYSLKLPVVNRHDNSNTGLSFDFIENQPLSTEFDENFVKTGHRDGIITINILEADRIHREITRQSMGEAYRTLLGHFRHEIGHYYWPLLFSDFDSKTQFRSLFGDDEVPYETTLDRYYVQGPAFDRRERCVSAYASSHPIEDWAETWAHYLHMVDTMETAEQRGLVSVTNADQDFGVFVGQWVQLTVAVNELSRSMGLADIYPFILNTTVRDKLFFIHQRIHDYVDPSRA